MNETLNAFKNYLLELKKLRLNYVKQVQSLPTTWDSPTARNEYYEGCLDTLNNVLLVFSSFFEEDGKVNDENN